MIIKIWPCGYWVADGADMPDNMGDDFFEFDVNEAISRHEDSCDIIDQLALMLIGDSAAKQYIPKDEEAYKGFGWDLFLFRDKVKWAECDDIAVMERFAEMYKQQVPVWEAVSIIISDGGDTLTRAKNTIKSLLSAYSELYKSVSDNDFESKKRAHKHLFESEVESAKALVSELDTIDITTLADFEIQDWDIDNEDLPIEHRDVYRCKIQQSKHTRQIYFDIYPKHLDAVDNEVTLNGLSGVLEVRGGRPALSVGVNSEEMDLYIESINYGDLFVHKNDHIKSQIASLPLGIGSNYLHSGIIYKCGASAWLNEAREQLAQNALESFNFGHTLTEAESNGWETADTYWKKVIFWENPAGGASIKGHFEVVFADNSTQIISVSGE